ncbi:DNA helicase II [Candidatus Profftia tarda]|uniref:DNA 3'-5' helicase n=1 Tax=Candidatus Profftia tarda TaxID=1177216 RepID=A0A8E4GHQ1_9ENTR|nr:DNA helicase II [Candidatus Profftia tarda]CAD6508130.1 DNA helicase II [Candidatus Profftia tarda]
MEFHYLLNNLNNKQREAVVATRSNILVLAGAGSGKTRVLVHRIAWLLSVEKCSPYSIMAVTFTHKAANEMRNRLTNLIGTKQSGMWIGTFHSLANRLLRAHHADANLPYNFQVINSNDQLLLIKRIVNMLHMQEKEYPTHQGMYYINNKKDDGLRPQYVKTHGNPVEEKWLNLYYAYQAACDRAGLVDFSELLLRTYELCLNKPQIIHDYRKRFTNILVDEFQDTNCMQYSWIQMLAGQTGRIMIVGDDDQSIYGWRGAKIENIQRFMNDFPSSETIRLEQNYRSTNNIIQAANALIKNNDKRFTKKIWTADNSGEKISLYRALNELDESIFVVNSIKSWQDMGGSLKDCAILYRKNIQSHAFEEAMLQMEMPYHIYGKQRLCERKEIKNTLAYLRLISNSNDDDAYECIINTPSRGIGGRTIDIIRQTASDRQLTLWQATHAIIQEKILNKRTSQALKDFVDLIQKMANKISDMPLHIQIDRVVQYSGLRQIYEQENNDKNQECINSLEELFIAMHQYKNDNENLLPLQSFIANSTFYANEKQIKKTQDAVQLMTLHSSKGLEFPLVFLVGMEEGLIPNQTYLKKDKCVEGERRLAYVGLTRAMRKLTITYAENRNLYGKIVCYRPSRFIGEIPAGYVEEVYPRMQL